MIQNRACRVIFGLKKRESVDHHMKSLHWLKIQQRIKFKILLITYKALNGQAPYYISELLQMNNISTRHQSNIQIPKNIDQKCFKFAAAKLWHELPHHVRELKDINKFKKSIKTYLFSESYCLS